ncbi:MAG TPA: YfiR family protein [Acidobacteriaceae bacterium]|nr:YfiR family protein [Acidobacteriaceae bacterium]
MKAAYLLNFGRFLRHTTLPDHSPSSFDLCILGQDPIGHSIDDIAANETINNLPVHIRRLPDVTDARACAIVLINAKDGDELREDLALLSGSDALTVSDAPDFLDRGGMIQFVLIQNHVRFAVNLNAVNRAHLALSSELLRVASSVIGKPPAEDVP